MLKSKLSTIARMVMMMIKIIITIFKIMIKELVKLFNLESLWMDVIREEQTLYRQQSGHILNKYDPNQWRDDYLW